MSILAEYIGPSAKFLIDDIELVAGKAVKVSEEIAARLAAVGRDHAFAFTKSDATVEPVTTTITPTGQTIPTTTATSTATYSPAAPQSGSLSKDDPPAPE